MRWSKILGLALLPVAHSSLSTDSLQDADPAQSGYLPNHNMNPTFLSTFKVQWRSTFNTKEIFYAKPLVWTAPGSVKEYVITVSNQNIVRILDGYAGTVIASRVLQPPFLTADTANPNVCGDIPNTIGIIGTPVIDAATDILYLYSKGYKNGAASGGTLNGQFKFYAIHLPTLADATGFPIIVSGHASNDPTRYFVAGTVNQRASLTQLGNIVMAGFGGHCDNFNYTGMFVAVSKTPGVGVTNIQAMEVSPGAPAPQTLDITVQGGGKAGIWHSGMGIATDVAGGRVFFVTGNARGNGVNGLGVPVTGLGKPISTLQQAATHFTVSTTGGLTQADYFEPYEYTTLNGGDRDFGSSGATLLDPYFSGGGITRMLVAGGKSGKIYIMNANNMGGFAMGANKGDAVIQTIVSATPMLSGVASYPGEGGYIYFCPSSGYLTAYKMVTSTSGPPQFVLAGKSALAMAGVGVPSVTSLNGTPGSAIVWMADVNNGIVAYNAVPVGGVLTRITLPANGRIQKYQRPAFGNARVYSTVVNQIYALGNTGVAARDVEARSGSLTCSETTIDFGTISVDQTSSITIACTATEPITLGGCTTDLDTFTCSGLPATVAAGNSFNLTATLDLSASNIEAAAQAGYQVKPGNEGSSLQILDASGFAAVDIELTAKVIAAAGFLVLNATQIDFGGLALGDSSELSLTLTNDGAQAVTLTGFAYQDLTTEERPFINVSISSSTIVGNGGFTANGFPTVGTQIAIGESIVLPITFAPLFDEVAGNLLTFWTDSGFADVMIVGTASAPSPGRFRRDLWSVWFGGMVR